MAAMLEELTKSIFIKIKLFSQWERILLFSPPAWQLRTHSIFVNCSWNLVIAWKLVDGPARANEKVSMMCTVWQCKYCVF